MPARGRGRRGALAIAVPLLIVGCATAPARRAPEVGALRAEEAVDLVHRWEAEWQAFVGLRAAVELTVERQGKHERTAALLLIAPTRLRLEVATPFGFPALVATAGPDRITIFRPLERRATIARPTPEAVARWLGAPFPLEVLIGLLVGRVPPPDEPTAVQVGGSDGSHLVYRRGAVEQWVWVTSQGQPARLSLRGSESVTVTFEWALGGHLQSVWVEAPQQHAAIRLRYLSVESVAPPPEAFELLLPVDVEVERLD